MGRGGGKGDVRSAFLCLVRKKRVVFTRTYSWRVNRGYCSPGELVAVINTLKHCRLCSSSDTRGTARLRQIPQDKDRRGTSAVLQGKAVVL